MSNNVIPNFIIIVNSINVLLKHSANLVLHTDVHNIRPISKTLSLIIVLRPTVFHFSNCSTFQCIGSYGGLKCESPLDSFSDNVNFGKGNE